MPNPTTIVMNSDDRPCPHGSGDTCNHCGKENILLQKVFIMRHGIRAYDTDELMTAFRMGAYEARTKPQSSIDQIMKELFFI